MLHSGVRNCTLSPAGHDYIGHLAETVSGRTCQAWSTQSPHNHRFTADDLFADGSVEGARNYCRNPEQQMGGGVWCYTTDPDKRWEECDVPTCGMSLLAESCSLEEKVYYVMRYLICFTKPPVYI